MSLANQGKNTLDMLMELSTSTIVDRISVKNTPNLIIYIILVLLTYESVHLYMQNNLHLL